MALDNFPSNDFSCEKPGSLLIDVAPLEQYHSDAGESETPRNENDGSHVTGEEFGLDLPHHRVRRVHRQKPSDLGQKAKDQVLHDEAPRE